MIVSLIERNSAIGLEISLESVRKCAEALLVAIEQAGHKQGVARRITTIIALACMLESLCSTRSSKVPL